MQLFKEFDQFGDGRSITWEAFISQLDTDMMRQFLEAADIGMEEATVVFESMDRDGSGQIVAEDFVKGCARINGPAKASDLVNFMASWQSHAVFMEEFCFWLSES